jgi:hypothetical protein
MAFCIIDSGAIVSASGVDVVGVSGIGDSVDEDGDGVFADRSSEGKKS